MTSKIEISHRTIIFTLLLLASVWVILQIRDILFLLFIAFILMSALRPFVEWLSWMRIPRFLAVLGIYSIVLGFVGISLLGSIPTIVLQSTRLANELPRFVEKVMPYWNIDTRALTQQIAPIGENILKLTVGIFSNIITTVTVLVFTFYFLIERRHVENILLDTFGETQAKTILTVLRDIELRLGAWVRGELLLMFLVGGGVYLGLTLLRIEFALPLAIIAGLLEIVPMIGPIVSAVLAVLVALATSPLLALSVVALYFIIQQVENSVIVPLVMRKSVGLAPVITILSLLIGSRLAGVTGAILAVPIVLVLQVVLSAFLNKSSKDRSP
ncbi:AI-2E family transporter [Candidatus Gottesmanbacteria bacterium]|nr:AI-2E family transporter [Candidatus Gottesmanbacteria bacterium]